MNENSIDTFFFPRIARYTCINIKKMSQFTRIVITINTVSLMGQNVLRVVLPLYFILIILLGKKLDII